MNTRSTTRSTTCSPIRSPTRRSHCIKDEEINALCASADLKHTATTVNYEQEGTVNEVSVEIGACLISGRLPPSEYYPEWEEVEGDDEEQAVMHAIQLANSGARWIRFNHKKIGDIGLIFFLRSINGNNLRGLDLTQCGITDNGIIVLIEALKGLGSLSCLSI